MIKLKHYTISQCLSSGVDQLKGVSDSPRIDAEVILAHVLKKDRSYLFAWSENIVETNLYSYWQRCLSRRLDGEPVAHILEEKEFWSLDLYTDKSTLIPRPDTEILVEKALLTLRTSPSRVLDLGTGTGAIALAIAKECPDCAIDAVDRSREALALALKNQKRHQLNNVNFFYSDWFSHVSGVYDLIVSNPPYIDVTDAHLNEGDVRFEPNMALVSEDNGLADLRHIIFSAPSHLNKNACLLVEHGWAQKAPVRELFTHAKYHSIETLIDYSGNDRACLGYL